jgi:hypothetical protein
MTLAAQRSIMHDYRRSREPHVPRSCRSSNSAVGSTGVGGAVCCGGSTHRVSTVAGMRRGVSAWGAMPATIARCQSSQRASSTTRSPARSPTSGRRWWQASFPSSPIRTAPRLRRARARCSGSSRLRGWVHDRKGAERGRYGSPLPQARSCARVRRPLGDPLEGDHRRAPAPTRAVA